jgi:hydrogenase maturation protease
MLLPVEVAAPRLEVRLEVPDGQNIGWQGSWSDSSHALGVGEAIALARALERLPSRLVDYGVEGARFGAGTEPHAQGG